MEFGWIRINHAGDCDLFPEMKDKSKVALFLIEGTCTMDEEEAANAAAVISPKIIIFMHYGRSKRSSDDPEKFKALVCSKNPNINMVILDSCCVFKKKSGTNEKTIRARKTEKKEKLSRKY